MIKSKIPAVLLAVLLALSLVSCGDSSETREAAAKLNGLIESANGESSISGDYVLEITFGENSVLYYAKGDIEFDRAGQRAFADFRQTWLGSAEAVQNYYSSGKMITVSEGEPLEIQRDAAELFAKFPYGKLPLWEDNGKITLGNNSAGETYSFVSQNTKAICETAIGDLYELVTVINKPQKDKTQYGDTTVTYTVKDGSINSCRYEFTAKLFDTPAYIPGGYQQPESEYTVDLKISAKVTYKSFGSADIKEYSETSETSEISS